MIAVEPKGKELEPCLKAKQRLWSNPPQFIDTIAEGIMTQQVSQFQNTYINQKFIFKYDIFQTGHLTFPILCDLVEDTVITVTNEDMLKAMKLVAERMKIVIEASAGASVAAAIFHTNEILMHYPDVSKIGVILCGGNTVLPNFP